MTPKELRTKKEKDLNALKAKWTAELVKLKIQASVGQCPTPARIGQIKKDLARLKTVRRERELNESSEAK